MCLALAGACEMPTGAPPTAPITDAPSPTSTPVHLRILGFNDFHGALDPPPGGIEDGTGRTINAGGVAYLASHLQRLRAESPHSAAVAAGDIIGASPLLSALFHDEPSIAAMNLAGLDLAAVGNHEFDEGVAELLRMQHGGCHAREGCGDDPPFSGARFGYLAANVLTESGETLFPAYAIREFGGVSVAFIGLTLRGTPTVTVAESVAGLRFDDEIQTVNALVPGLQARGVETIVVMMHEGGRVTGRFDECVGMAGPILDIVHGFDDAVDVVVSGHTHSAYVCEIDGKIVTSAGSSGRFISVTDLVIDPRTSDVVAKTAKSMIVTHEVTPLPALEQLVEGYRQRADPLAHRVVGVVLADATTKFDENGESVLGDVIADAQLEASRREGAQLALMNPGGIRADLLVNNRAGTEAPGEVVFEEIFSVHPFGNTLVTMTLTGEQVHRLLEAQWRDEPGGERARVLQISKGSSYVWDPDAQLGARIDPRSVQIDGQPLDLAKRYRVTVNNFLAEGGDTFAVLSEGTDRVTTEPDIAALERFLTNHSPYQPPGRGRIRRERGSAP